jgi:hypothetical protein
METPAVIYQLPRGVRAVIHDPNTDAAGKAAILARCRATVEARRAIATRRGDVAATVDLDRLARVLARAHEEWRA